MIRLSIVAAALLAVASFESNEASAQYAVPNWVYRPNLQPAVPYYVAPRVPRVPIGINGNIYPYYDNYYVPRVNYYNFYVVPQRQQIRVQRAPLPTTPRLRTNHPSHYFGDPHGSHYFP